MKKFLQITMALFLAVNLSSCSKDDEPEEVSDSSKIIDKKWYYSNSSYEWKSNGEFLLEGNLRSNWVWEDEDALIMKISKSGSPDAWYKFTNVTDTTVNVVESFDEPPNYIWFYEITYTSN